MAHGWQLILAYAGMLFIVSPFIAALLLAVDKDNRQ